MRRTTWLCGAAATAAASYLAGGPSPAGSAAQRVGADEKPRVRLCVSSPCLEGQRGQTWEPRSVRRLIDWAAASCSIHLCADRCPVLCLAGPARLQAECSNMQTTTCLNTTLCCTVNLTVSCAADMHGLSTAPALQVPPMLRVRPLAAWSLATAPAACDVTTQRQCEVQTTAASASVAAFLNLVSSGDEHFRQGELDEANRSYLRAFQQLGDAGRWAGGAMPPEVAWAVIQAARTLVGLWMYRIAAGASRSACVRAILVWAPHVVAHLEAALEMFAGVHSGRGPVVADCHLLIARLHPSPGAASTHLQDESIVAAGKDNALFLDNLMLLAWLGVPAAPFSASSYEHASSPGRELLLAWRRRVDKAGAACFPLLIAFSDFLAAYSEAQDIVLPACGPVAVRHIKEMLDIMHGGNRH